MEARIDNLLYDIDNRNLGNEPGDEKWGVCIILNTPFFPYINFPGFIRFAIRDAITSYINEMSTSDHPGLIAAPQLIFNTTGSGNWIIYLEYYRDGFDNGLDPALSRIMTVNTEQITSLIRSIFENNIPLINQWNELKVY